MRTLFVTFFALSTIMLQANEELPEQKIAAKETKWIDISLYNGYLSGKSNEVVYSSTQSGEVYIMSQLDWDTGNLWVIGGKVTTRLFSDLAHLSVSGWTKGAVSSATMVDRDWLDENSTQTLSSISWSASHLKTAYKLVGEVLLDSNTYNRGRLAIKYGTIMGYEYMHLLWNDRGGYYIYNNGHNARIMDNRIGITYKQTYSLPYWGIQSDFSWNKILQTVFYFKFAPYIAYVWTQDNHHLRDMIFDEQFNRCYYWMVGAFVRCKVWKNLDCDVKYDYEQLNTAIGTTTLHEKDKPDRKYGGAGLFHKHQTISLGLSATF